jgi:hypothetical protein
VLINIIYASPSDGRSFSDGTGGGVRQGHTTMDMDDTFTFFDGVDCRLTKKSNNSSTLDHNNDHP